MSDAFAASPLPLVSIVLTTLNGARYLRQSLDSCLGQTYRNIELLVVDGGSTDGTLDILAEYHDERVRIIHQVGNAGKLPGAINLGLAHANGEYLTWTQDDCYYATNAIEKMVDVLERRPEIGQTYADWWLLRVGHAPEWIHVPPPNEIASSKSDVVGVCFLIRRKVREVIGEHSLDAYPSQDYDYRLRISQHFQSERIEEALYFYRLHESSLTGRLGWPLLARKDAEIRTRLGLTTVRQQSRDLASIDVAEAFEHYQCHHWNKVPRLVLNGLRRDPRYAFNRGVWSILLKSVAELVTSPSPSRSDA
jgi:glycosyltransferase involved in cell wall biosynthesis